MVERAALEMRCTGNCTGGSNPSLSARPRSKKVSRNRYLLFFIPCRKLACRQRCEKQRERLAAFCAVGLQGPLRRAEGKGVKRSDHRERSSQFSLSARLRSKKVSRNRHLLFISPVASLFVDSGGEQNSSCDTT